MGPEFEVDGEEEGKEEGKEEDEEEEEEGAQDAPRRQYAPRSHKFENYRPIQLQSTLYKLVAAILHIRISDALDRHLQKHTIWI